MDGAGGLFVQLHHKKDDRDIGGIFFCISGCNDLQFMDTKGVPFLAGDVGTIEGDVREQPVLWRIFGICGVVLCSDNHGVEEIRKLLLGLKEEGKLILIISHNREDTRLLCDRVYEMDMGVLTQIK